MKNTGFKPLINDFIKDGKTFESFSYRFIFKGRDALRYDNFDLIKTCFFSKETEYTKIFFQHPFNNQKMIFIDAFFKDKYLKIDESLLNLTNGTDIIMHKDFFVRAEICNTGNEICLEIKIWDKTSKIFFILETEILTYSDIDHIVLPSDFYLPLVNKLTLSYDGNHPIFKLVIPDRDPVIIEENNFPISLEQYSLTITKKTEEIDGIFHIENGDEFGRLVNALNNNPESVILIRNPNISIFTKSLVCISIKTTYATVTDNTVYRLTNIGQPWFLQLKKHHLYMKKYYSQYNIIWLYIIMTPQENFKLFKKPIYDNNLIETVKGINNLNIDLMIYLTPTDSFMNIPIDFVNSINIE